MAYFGRAKPKVGEREDKTPYTTYWIHSIDRLEASKKAIQRNYVKIVSIDPATKTFAIRIEIRGIKPNSNDIIMEPVYYKIWNVGDVPSTDPNVPNSVYANLTREFNGIKEQLLDVNIILIERQPPINYKSARIMQHAISYFTFLLMDSPYYPTIYDVDPRLKGKILGAPKGISYNELKKWSVMEAKKLLEHCKDTWSLSVVNSHTKNDDLCDTVCQIEAIMRYWEHNLRLNYDS